MNTFVGARIDSGIRWLLSGLFSTAISVFLAAPAATQTREWRVDSANSIAVFSVGYGGSYAGRRAFVAVSAWPQSAAEPRSLWPC